jgi:predicted transcriptional regulator
MRKTQILETLESLPEEFTIDELVDKLIIIERINKGLRDIEEGKSMSHEEAKKKVMGKWQN